MTKAKAISLFGGVGKLAIALKIQHQAVSQWPEGEIKNPRGAHVLVVAAERGMIPPIGMDSSYSWRRKK